MPQQTLFDGWNLTDMTISVSLPVNKAGGRISCHFLNELGKPAGGNSVQWNKARDLSDLGLVVKDVADAFMWAPHVEVLAALKVAARRHLVFIPAGDPRSLVR